MYKNRVIDDMHGINMKLGNVLFVLLIVFMIALNVVSFPVQAQPAQQWAPDQRVPGYLDDTFTPFLIADQNRTVHAFASQWIDDGDRRLAIIYRKWSLSGGWTRPLDVLLASSGNTTFLGAFLDVSGTIHIIFGEGENQSVNIFYSFVPADMADSLEAWSTPVIIGSGLSGVNSAAMSGDRQGNLVVIYSGNFDGSGVYTIHSSDAGQNWSDPIRLFAPNDSGLTPYSLRLVSDQETRIQATWNVVTALGVDEALYFSSYDVASGNWTKPLELDTRINLPEYFGPSFPSIVDNGNEIVIMYNGGNPFTGFPVDYGRPVQRVTVSSNGGQSWSEAINPFPFHVGRSGEHSLALDSVGRPHALFIQRIETLVDGKYSIVGGIWHSIFENGIWTNPDRFVTTLAPSNVRSVVSQGNVLLVVWIEDQGQGQHGVWYSYSILDSPELPIAALSTQSATSTIGHVPFTPTITPVTTTPTDLSQLDNLSKKKVDNPAFPLFVGVISALSLIVVFLILYYSNNPNRR